MVRWRHVKLWSVVTGSLVTALVIAALVIWSDDIVEAFLDPKLPYAVYRQPSAPDYAKRSAWALLPGPLQPGDPAADVFFVHPTTFDGGKDWNGPIEDRRAAAVLSRSMLPNYAAPYAQSGRVFAPRYRQASLYTSLTLFDDAIEAREFAYRDVRAAFEAWRARERQDRPFFVVGVEQGGSLAARLLAEMIAPDALLRRRLVAAYLIEVVVPADATPGPSAIPPCIEPDQTGCLAAWVSAPRLDFMRAQRLFQRSLVWNAAGRLAPLAGRSILCVNPILGRETDDPAPVRLNLGAANATGLEWRARPGLMARQVGAQCVQGILRISGPRSGLLRSSSELSQRLKAPSFNLFWADIEADAARRLIRWLTLDGRPSPPPG